MGRPRTELNQTSVAKALSVARAEKGNWLANRFGGFRTNSQVRDRSSVGSASLRQPEYLPPAEIDQAIIEAISRSVAVDNEEVARGVAEALGFAATSAQLRAVVGERARHLVAAATITETHGLLRLISGA
jgi:hypothetical protein